MSAHTAHVQKETKYNNNNGSEVKKDNLRNKFDKRVRAARNTNVCHI